MAKKRVFAALAATAVIIGAIAAGPPAQASVTKASGGTVGSWDLRN